MSNNQTDKPVKRNRKSNKRLIIALTSFVAFMFIFSYLMVPIFTFVCKQIGLNGKSGLVQNTVKSNMAIDATRTIKIQLTSVMHKNLKFDFRPLQKEIIIHPGERKLIYYYAENQTGMEKTVQAVPSITPIDAARFLKKVECFCFTQQYFDKDEKAKMFVNFYIDPDISPDIKEITLAYTLFDASKYAGKQPKVTKGRIRL